MTKNRQIRLITMHKMTNDNKIVTKRELEPTFSFSVSMATNVTTTFLAGFEPGFSHAMTYELRQGEKKYYMTYIWLGPIPSFLNTNTYNDSY
jgi:hypothetical protein